MAMSQPFNVAAVFREELDKAVADETRHSGFQPEDWFASGPKGAPQAIEEWYNRGPEMVQNFIDWWEHNPDVEVWVTPDGVPAIELPITVNFGSIPVKMYIDLVLRIGTALVVVDWKSGAKAPDNHRQLGIYACGVELAHGIRPRYGTWFMARGTGPRNGPKTFFQRPVELDRPQFSVAYLTREFEQAERGIQAGVFPANPGDRCGRCGVSYACTETGGYRAKQLDPNYPRG
jgi:putative RecB family exonuclease